MVIKVQDTRHHGIKQFNIHIIKSTSYNMAMVDVGGKD